jgi:hypothetical protein
MSFYTYMWLREDGTPYYVGKGSGDRAFHYHRNVGAAPAPERIHVLPCSDKATALAFEIYLIDFWGRADLGTGCLDNKNDGGDKPPSSKGLKRSEATKEKHRVNRARLYQDPVFKEANRAHRAKFAVTAGKARGQQLTRDFEHQSRAGKMAAHKNFHVKKGVIKEGCALCH